MFDECVTCRSSRSCHYRNALRTLLRLLRVEFHRASPWIPCLSHDVLRRIHLRRVEIGFVLAATVGLRNHGPQQRVNIRRFAAIAVLALLAGCAGDTHHRILISAADQRMIVFRDDEKIAEYRCRPPSLASAAVQQQCDSGRTVSHQEEDRRWRSRRSSFQIRRLTGRSSPSTLRAVIPLSLASCGSMVWRRETRIPRSAHLHPWDTGGAEHRLASQLWVHSHEVRGRDLSLYDTVGPGPKC